MGGISLSTVNQSFKAFDVPDLSQYTFLMFLVPSYGAPELFIPSAIFLNTLGLVFRITGQETQSGKFILLSPNTATSLTVGDYLTNGTGYLIIWGIY